MFKQVAVIGSGTMGAGIAGQVANAGIDVWLLDLPSEGDDVNAIARRGLERLQDPNQPGLMSEAAEARIQLGNIRDDLGVVADCDWVAEAVVEQLPVKLELYARLAPHLHDEAILSSNTSTIPISLLTQGMSQSLQSRFAITHFFNPVRFMRLLELVRGEHTADDVIDQLDAFCEQELGKGVVRCADTPGFLGNRVGVYAIQCALHEAFNLGFSPPIADALFGRPMGIPKTGVFGLYDLIGIDLMSDVVKSLVSILPESDAFHSVAAPIPLMQEMIAKQQTGNKQGRGFYFQPDEVNGTPAPRQVLDFESGDYGHFDRPQIASALQAEQGSIGYLLDDDSDYGRYAWRVLSKTLCYAASLIPEVGDDPSAIDDAMKLGYNWQRGPFELLDEIGLDYFTARLQQESQPIPAFLQRVKKSEPPQFYRADGETLAVQHWQDDATTRSWKALVRPAGLLRFNEVRQTLAAENRNAVASWYVYEGVAVVEFHSKANALDGDSMAILADALAQAPSRGLDGLIVHNDAQHFSCGVNLGAVQGYYQREDYDGLDQFLNNFQQTVLAMRLAPFPVVAAPVGMSIGGGFEVVLHAQSVIAHGNSVMGLVESHVGLVPGGGGCKESLYRWVEKLGDQPGSVEKAAWKAFMQIGYGQTATSPQQARAMAMLRDRDPYLMNRDRQLAVAITQVNSGDLPRQDRREPLVMPGQPAFEAMLGWLDKAKDKGVLTTHDCTVGTAIADVVTGGNQPAGTRLNEQDLFDAERRVFLSLAQTLETQARIDHLLDLGLRLRN